MKLTDALGLGPYDGRTVLPVSVWLPVLVLFSLLAAVVLTSMDGESALTQLVIVAAAGALVVVVATAIARLRRRR